MPTTDRRARQWGVHRELRCLWWRTRAARHWLRFEVKRQYCWIGVSWTRENHFIADGLDVRICLLPCLVLFYLREVEHDNH